MKPLDSVRFEPTSTEEGSNSKIIKHKKKFRSTITKKMAIDDKRGDCPGQDHYEVSE